MARAVSNRRAARASRVIMISRRGGSSSSADAGNFVGYLASVPGGRADLRVVIANGMVQPASPKPNRDWEFFDYVLGALTLGNGGYGWNGAVSLPVPYLSRVGLENFDAYAVGAAPDLGGGSGWSTSALLGTPYLGRAGVEKFDTYANGTVTGADLNGGSGWAGTPLITAY